MRNNRRALLLLASLFFLTPSSAPAATGEYACIRACPSRRGAFGKRTYDKKCVLKCLSANQTPRARTRRAFRSALSAIRMKTLIGKLNPLSVAYEVRGLKDAERKAREALIKAQAELARARRAGDRRAAREALRKIAAAKAALKKVLAKKNTARLISESMKNLRKGFSSLLGRQTLKEMEKIYGFYRDPLLEKKVSEILALLSRKSLRPGDRLKFKILNTKSISTVAATDGETIYIDKAYLDLKPSRDELMFVLSHEMAHAHLDHLLLIMSHHAGLTFEEMYLPARVTSKDPRVKRAIERTVHDIRVGQYSQDKEREADLLGARVALAAGASPWGIKETIDRLIRLEGPYTKKSGRALTQEKQAILKGSHPRPMSRLRDLERALGHRFWTR